MVEPRDILDRYSSAIDAGQRLLVGSVNLHTAYCHKTDSSVRAFFKLADLVYADGMPVIWWLKCLGYRAAVKHRAAFIDWLPALFRKARDRKWRLFYLGNEPGVTSRVAADFRQRLPGLIVESAPGYFDHTPDSAANLAMVERINAFDPDVLIVGMGMPLQERWILANASSLNARVIHRCGATAEVFAGAVPLAPRWLGRLGLEGAFRLATRPRRLWRRYLVEPWFLLDLAARDLAGRRRPIPTNQPRVDA